MPSLAAITLALDGLTPGDVPIASAKRRSTASALGGSHFRIGRIWANRAFVVRRGQTNLLYVHIDYRGYARAARRVFAPTTDQNFDYDHALGRAIARELGFTYVLLVRVPKSVNRSHGSFERPTARGGLSFRKTSLTDARILRKMLGLKNDQIARPNVAYDLNSSHNPPLNEDQVRAWAFALGVDPLGVAPQGLTQIYR